MLAFILGNFLRYTQPNDFVAMNSVAHVQNYMSYGLSVRRRINASSTGAR
jgi:hypothetical protein